MKSDVISILLSPRSSGQAVLRFLSKGGGEGGGGEGGHFSIGCFFRYRLLGWHVWSGSHLGHSFGVGHTCVTRS